MARRGAGMNIYIRIEVLSRELQGRLLLALVAAERGHRVIIGKHNASRLLGTEGALGYPAGIFHDKSLGHSDPKTEVKKEVFARGWGLTAQDEEHGLVTEQFGHGMLDRFPEEGFDYNHRLYTWGDLDTAALQRMLPDRAENIRRTGSPRVDLWRPDIAGSLSADEVLEVTHGRRYVLVNPIGGWIPGGPESVFGIDGTDDDVRRIADVTDGLRLMSRFIQAADALAEQDPERLVILRPHPGAPLEIWEKATDRCRPNVIVSRRARLTPWLRNAEAVVANGSTVAFEAQLLGTPHITYAPDGYFAYEAVTHRIGRTATTLGELMATARDARDASHRRNWYDEGMAEVVRERFSALEGALAADRIVDDWGTLGSALGLQDAEEWSASRHLVRSRREAWRKPADLLRRSAPAETMLAEALPEQVRASSQKARWVAPKSTFTEKFPPFDMSDIHAFHSDLARATGRFARIRVEPQHDRLLLVTTED